MNVAPWTQTACSRAVDLLAPQPEQILLADIARALSRIPRFNGATHGDVAFSVASHSLLVAELAAVSHVPEEDNLPTLRLAAMLHDAHEAYMGDLVSPMKAALGTFMSFERVWHTVETGIQAAIHTALGLPTTLPDGWAEKIRRADLQALELERRAFMLPIPRAWIDLPEPPAEIDGALLTPEAPLVCERRFIEAVMRCICERHGICADATPDERYLTCP